MFRYCLALTLVFTVVAIQFESAGAKDKKEPGKKESYLLVVPPAGGKEVKLADWRLTFGTRRLPLASDAPAKAKPTGPEFLEFREEKSTTYKNGILTLVPLTSIRKLDYNRAKKTVTAVVINASGEDATLVGSTKFASNKLTIEGESILEGLGAATVKFQGGTDKGLQRVTFPDSKPAEMATGAQAVITADDKEKTKHVASDLQPVWLVNGQYRVVPYIAFKKTVKIDMDKIAGWRFVPSEDKKKLSNDYEVTLKDGAKHTLTILTTVELEKKKSMTFVGLIGRVPVGYKLFMLDAIYEFRAAADEKK